MSWFGNLIETYDLISEIVGKYDKNENGNVLLPFGHMLTNTDVCITIDGYGKFRRVTKTKESIAIPCTEDSASRTSSAICPHPLHEQLGYLASDEKKRAAYLLQLEKWCKYHHKVEAVYKYISGETILDDLQESSVKIEKQNLFVRFSVEVSLDNFDPNLWKDDSVAAAWQEYCDHTEPKFTTLCYATGDITPIRLKHPGGINTSANRAKLISCNDHNNYTYRGRFSHPEQASTIGAVASHRAHAMLKYLIATQGYKCDTQAIVAWAIDDGTAMPSPVSDSLGIHENRHRTERDELITAQGKVGYNYAKNVCSALNSTGSVKRLRESNRRTAVIAVNAVKKTTGRMAVTFYRELQEDEYLDRIDSWHESCSWWFRRKGIDFIQAPSVDLIIAAVHGELKGENHYKILKQERERLLHCIFNGAKINHNWHSAALNRVSNPFSYRKSDGGWDKNGWDTAISVTCAIARKHFDKKEEYDLELDKNCCERNYLWGRMLAVADRIEDHARYQQEDKKERPTNAMRYMTAFTSKPYTMWLQIIKCLNPYFLQLNGGGWYQIQIDEIMARFVNENEYMSNAQLDGRFLMGYSLQRRELYKKKDKEEKTEDAEQKD